MLDLHVHVLPGIDDGPRTLDDALALARALAADGIEHLVATPHIYPGVFDNTPQKIADAFDRLQSAIAAEALPLSITWAAEVRICPEILDWLEQRRLPLLDGSLVGPSSALIEWPDSQIPVGTDRLMALLIDRGITPLIAHPERNKAVMDQPSRLEVFRRMGCRFQLTAGSVLGEFGGRAQAAARHLLDSDWADVIASDAHNLSGRKPRMSAAREWIGQNYDTALAQRLLVTTPQKIAGVSSFSVESAGQKLVFRDMPAAQQAAKDSAWQSGLGLLDSLLEEVQTQPSPTSARPPLALMPSGPERNVWSLIDFHINAVVKDLNQAAQQASSSSTAGDHLFDMEMVKSLAAKPNSRDEEDWTLPDFSLSHVEPANIAPAPIPEPMPAATSAETTTATLVSLMSCMPSDVIVPAVQAPNRAQTSNQEKPPIQQTSVAAAPVACTTPTFPSTRGLRLRDLEQLVPSVPPRNVAAHTEQTPAALRPGIATRHADVARRGMATAVSAPHKDPTVQFEETRRPAQLSLQSDGSVRGIRLDKIPVLPSIGKR